MTFKPHPKTLPKEKKPPTRIKRTAKVYERHKPFKYVKPATGELAVFRAIISKMTGYSVEELHDVNTITIKSEISGQLIYNPTPSNCLHILPKAKNKYPKFKLYPKNILIGTVEEHRQWDTGLREELKQFKIWQPVFELEAELLKEYEMSFPSRGFYKKRVAGARPMRGEEE